MIYLGYFLICITWVVVLGACYVLCTIPKERQYEAMWEERHED